MMVRAFPSPSGASSRPLVIQEGCNPGVESVRSVPRMHESIKERGSPIVSARQGGWTAAMPVCVSGIGGHKPPDRAERSVSSQLKISGHGARFAGARRDGALHLRCGQSVQAGSVSFGGLSDGMHMQAESPPVGCRLSYQACSEMIKQRLVC